MVIITSGIKYVDIDGLASAVALQDLLKLRHEDAMAVLAGPLNHSVTKTIKYWGLDYASELRHKLCDFILVDVSEGSHFPTFVDQNAIVGIFDHHYGFEKFWQERLGEKSVIEPVGACATLIWEQYKKYGQEKNIKTVTASLLSTAIVSNTLNFKSGVTTQRDIDAFNELRPFDGQKEEWIRQYFEEQEDGIFNNIMDAIIRDTKIQKIPKFDTELVMGQLEFWNSKQFLENHKQVVQDALESFNNDKWFFNCPSIEENKTRIFAKNETVKELLSKVLKVDFYNDIAETNKLILRKEILKELYNLHS
jgi:inorganic pyrophosphatase/exopolyphosphatase